VTLEPRHRIVFVGGLHRSGTTLLARLLGEHPEVSGLENTGVWEDEGQHLQDAYPTAKQLGGPGRFAFHPDAGLDADSSLVGGDTRDRLLAAWEPFWDLDRGVLVEKSPPNLLRMRFLQALFPGAQFVAVLRHPLAVSYATQKWSRTPLSSLLRHWVVAHERFRGDIGHLSCVRIVRYEDLVAAPAAVVGQLFEWLRLPPGPAQSSVKGGINERYLARFGPGSNPLKQLRAAALHRRFEGRVTPYGYSLRAGAPLARAAAEVERYLIHPDPLNGRE
jgi:hypothetical protein